MAAEPVAQTLEEICRPLGAFGLEHVLEGVQPLGGLVGIDGPYVYAREAFGDFAAFQTVWSYWFSAVIGNAAIVTGVVGYAVGFSATLA